ncbi:biopolymer transporter ExbD [Leeia sp. TBRC 13508]|uniref:Biopolymer transporter ExbD n=1 Tax=Leeia speluncae TaxID=2884804 RepID=A0ABS8D7K1_9NEIS|nr:biopolymer transporter ExbD [Leeia speluncae]MCB6184146.1 biopolymer transporter ExbD [Leeia speluncae]
MNFHRGKHREEPEINFIPLIDLLLVILIFLMVTTTYSRFAELQINLPTAKDAPQPEKQVKTLNVAVDAQGKFSLNNQPFMFTNTDELATLLKKTAGEEKDPVVVINADANARHQNVVDIMEAASEAGFGQVTFATQNPKD